jgi:hypothetical protein
MMTFIAGLVLGLLVCLCCKVAGRPLSQHPERDANYHRPSGR